MSFILGFWLMGALALTNAHAQDLQARCSQLVLKMKRPRINQRLQSLQNEQRALAALFADINGAFTTAKEQGFVAAFTRHIETLRDGFNLLHRGTGLVAETRTHSERLDLDSSGLYYSVPYLAFKLSPTPAVSLSNTQIGHELVELFSQHRDQVEVTYDPMVFFVGHPRRRLASETWLKRPIIFLNISDVLAVDTVPTNLKHEVARFNGQLNFKNGKIHPLRHARIVPRNHQVDHFFSNDLKSPHPLGLALDDLDAYEASLRASLYNLGIALQHSAHAEAIDAAREFYRAFLNLDTTFLDASVAFRIAIENLLEPSTKAFLEKSPRGEYWFVAGYSFDGNPLAAPGSQPSHAELKIPTLGENVRWIDRLNLSTSLANRIGNRRIALNMAQRENLQKKLQVMRELLKKQYSWLTPVSEIIHEPDLHELTIGDLAVRYQIYLELLNTPTKN